jgi:hypothetical protein
MSSKETNLRARLRAAPAKEPKTQSVKAVVDALRTDLLKARREKNWSIADLREWLAREGVEVTEGTLKKYLAVSRKPAGETPDAAGDLRRDPSAGQGRRVVNPLASAATKPARSAADQSSREGLSRASFQIRPDTPDI